MYDSQVIGPRKIKTLIEDLGYTAELVTEDNLSSGMDERSREIKFWKRKFWIGFVFSLPVFLIAMIFEHTPGTKEGLNTNVGGLTVGILVKWVLTTPVLVSLLKSGRNIESQLLMQVFAMTQCKVLVMESKQILLNLSSLCCLCLSIDWAIPTNGHDS